MTRSKGKSFTAAVIDPSEQQGLSKAVCMSQPVDVYESSSVEIDQHIISIVRRLNSLVERIEGKLQPILLAPILKKDAKDCAFRELPPLYNRYRENLLEIEESLVNLENIIDRVDL